MTIDHRITAGFIPLTDSVLLVVAREKGFAAAEGVELTLVREISWANIRDRVAVGQFDVAHMLAPMPIAASLGFSPIDVPVIAAMGLGLGGNAVTVSTALWQRMSAAGAPADFSPRAVGAALATVVRTDKPKLAVVHPYSSHNYELRYWLAASGIHPGRDVEIVIVPPPLMADALVAGRIDGYCVGEPWGSVAVAAGTGRIATVKAAIWPSSPEKVLGVTESWAAANGDALAALIRALHHAARWCGDPRNRTEAAQILSQPAYLGQPAEIIVRALSGSIAQAPGVVVPVDDFFVPHAQAANLPNPGDALWYYSQMVRWNDVPHSDAAAATAAASYRPELYQDAVRPLGIPATEPARGAFFDGVPYDPARLETYLADQRKRDMLLS